MPYLYLARQYAINTLPNLKDDFLKQERGIFETESKETKPLALDEQIHSVLFPVSWRECQVNLVNLWMMEECTSEADFTHMTQLFANGDHLKDEESFNRASALIFKLIENQQIPPQV
jgi:hypothetical protein